MSASESNDRGLDFIADDDDHDDDDDDYDDELYDDNGDAIGTRASLIANGLHSSAGDRLDAALALLNHQEFARILANRVSIEQATGMLMYIYGIDADQAFELLKWRAQTSGVGVRDVAEQLSWDLVHTPRPAHVDLPAWCDQLLVTVHERVSPAPEMLAVAGAEVQQTDGTGARREG